MAKYQDHTFEDRSELFYNKMREGYGEWTKIKDRLLICFAIFLGFKPGDIALTKDKLNITKMNSEIIKMTSKAIQLQSVCPAPTSNSSLKQEM